MLRQRGRRPPAFVFLIVGKGMGGEKRGIKVAALKCLLSSSPPPCIALVTAHPQHLSSESKTECSAGRDLSHQSIPHPPTRAHIPWPAESPA